IWLHRRQYRLDLKKDQGSATRARVADEVEHVLAVVRMIGGPVVIYGHSSGGLFALEALLASPSLFAGGVIRGGNARARATSYSIGSAPERSMASAKT